MSDLQSKREENIRKKEEERQKRNEEIKANKAAKAAERVRALFRSLPLPVTPCQVGGVHTCSAE